MAKIKNITRVRAFDPAYEAKLRADQVGEDDAAYERAIADLESAPATTRLGVQAKFEHLCSYLTGEHVLTPKGWKAVLRLCDGIAEGQKRLELPAVA